MPEVRPEELVGRAEQDVEPELARAQAAVRREVHAVGPGERADAVRRGGDPGRVRDRADRVRGERERDHPGALADQRLERVDVERHVVGADRRGSHDQVAVLRDEQPRRHVGVVVERGDHDLVARLERARDRVREQEVERRHVGAERDPVRLAAGELGGGRARPRSISSSDAAEVGKAPPRFALELAQVAVDGVEHLLRRLRAARPVEVGGAGRERREALRGARATSSIGGTLAGTVTRPSPLSIYTADEGLMRP